MDRGPASAREGNKGRGGRMDGKSGARQPQSDSARISLLFRTRWTLWIQFLVSDNPQTRNGPPKSDGDLDCGVPYLLGVVVMLWNGWHSDRTGERRWHTSSILFFCGAFMALAVGFQANLWLGLVLLILSVTRTTAFMPSFWQLPTAMLRQSSAAASIGLTNS